MANLTLAVDDDLLRRARVRAAEQGTSVNAVVRDLLIAYAATVALIVPLGTVGALRNLRTQVPPAVRAS